MTDNRTLPPARTVPKPATRSARAMSKADFEALAGFRYQLRRFLRFSEEVTRGSDITPLQYQLMLQVRGYPGRDWASVAELAERLQAKHHGVVSLVSRCEALGLVERRASQSDMRRVEVHLTALGNTVIARLAALHRVELESLRALLDQLPSLGRQP
jgi:DNA-binding MarR family transcriptional regulator